MAQPLTAIEYQTKSIKNEIPLIDEKQYSYAEKSNYQMQMYNSVKFVNQSLLFFYVIIFTVVHILILIQYVQGVKRDAVTDTIWLIILFLYPYLIYYLEKAIYFCITYLLSFVYGKTYVYQFDQLLLFTDFYTEPVNN